MSEKALSEAERTLGYLLRLAYEELQARVYGSLAESGYPDIRIAHSSVFRHIARTGSRVTELAERALMTKQSMAYLVETLADAGYLKVTPDPNDGRAKIVCLTIRGQKVSRMLLRLSGEVEAEFSALLGDGKMTVLRDHLNDLAIALESSGR